MISKNPLVKSVKLVQLPTQLLAVSQCKRVLRFSQFVSVDPEARSRVEAQEAAGNLLSLKGHFKSAGRTSSRILMATKKHSI